jgi:hypothetical protein
MKTSELQGAALDWAVAIAEGDELAAKNIEHPHHAKFYPKISPSTDWAIAGPIIERERISIASIDPHWQASVAPDYEGVDGPTPLVAAMRCYVASKLGDTVDIPEELQ